MLLLLLQVGDLFAESGELLLEMLLHPLHMYDDRRRDIDGRIAS